MDAVQALAILSLGAFLTVLVSAIVYAVALRPRLLASAPAEVDGALTRSLLNDELHEQRMAIEQLADLLEQQSPDGRDTVAVVTPEERDELTTSLRTQAEAAEALKVLLSDQSTQITWVDGRLNYYETKLDQIASRLDVIAAERDESDAAEETGEAEDTEDGKTLAGSDSLEQILAELRSLAPANAVDRLTVQVEQVSKRLDDMVPLTAHEAIAETLSEQAGQLAEITSRLQDWAARNAQAEDNAGLLAGIDQRLAAQAEIAAQIDAKVNEHTSLLQTTAAEQRGQADLLLKTGELLDKIYPTLDRVSNVHIPPTRDRLTDINGIGPVYAAKLYEAGVDTFEELASLTPDEIQSIVKLPRWRYRVSDMTSWSDQARALAVRREKLED
ncbi:MAG TPA: helix-hairpin-helix domain-containing protein [Aggregatilinea sp.]|uniref:helix-hairpin-helix domain-containing protein n=1 Tax=Aggregatilinea sp. TaxID=2806333 RepID=UPI002CECFC4B|nr:helix-hairpin-helix domain-containing protein [Aggregatilinea sp.]HML21019.1 helix-hairpin-helix domain-containing protein [Aggregatilinea sp.]